MCHGPSGSNTVTAPKPLPSHYPSKPPSRNPWDWTSPRLTLDARGLGSPNKLFGQDDTVPRLRRVPVRTFDFKDFRCVSGPSRLTVPVYGHYVKRKNRSENNKAAEVVYRGSSVVYDGTKSMVLRPLPFPPVRSKKYLVFVTRLSEGSAR